jgi:hypothetical protein
MSEVHGPANMANYLVYVPATVSWSMDWGGQYTHGGTRDGTMGHIAFLPYSGNPEQVYDDVIDKLRGEELMNFDCGFRGQNTVSVDTSTVQAKYSGFTVKPNVGSAQTIGSTFIIGTPAENELMIAEDNSFNKNNLQLITGVHSWGSRINWPEIQNNNGLEFPTWYWTNRAGRDGAYGIPVIWPDTMSGLGPVKFSLLEMEVFDADGLKVGYLDRWARGSFIRDNGRNPGEYSVVKKQELPAGYMLTVIAPFSVTEWKGLLCGWSLKKAGTLLK